MTHRGLSHVETLFFLSAGPTRVTDLLQASVAMAATRGSALAFNLGDQAPSSAAALPFTSPLFTPLPCSADLKLSFRTATYTTDAHNSLWRRGRRSGK